MFYLIFLSEIVLRNLNLFYFKGSCCLICKTQSWVYNLLSYLVVKDLYFCLDFLDGCIAYLTWINLWLIVRYLSYFETFCCNSVWIKWWMTPTYNCISSLIFNDFIWFSLNSVLMMIIRSWLWAVVTMRSVMAVMAVMAMFAMMTMMAAMAVMTLITITLFFLRLLFNLISHFG